MYTCAGLSLCSGRYLNIVEIVHMFGIENSSLHKQISDMEKMFQCDLWIGRSEAFSDIMEEAEAEGQDESASLDFAILHLDISRDRLFSIE